MRTEGPDVKGESVAGGGSQPSQEPEHIVLVKGAHGVPGWAGLPRKGIALRFGSSRWAGTESHPPCRAANTSSLKHRARGEQPGLAGVRVPDPQAHPAALRLPADGASADHPLRAQRHWEDLPGQPAVRVPGAPGGTGADRRGHRHLQRGPQVQQGEEVVQRQLLSPLRTSDATTPVMAKQHFLQCSPLMVLKAWGRRSEWN